MHSQTAARVEKIKSRVLEGRTSLSQLKAQLSHNTDKHVNELLRQTAYWFDDVKSSFLGMMVKEQRPPRTLEDESYLLNQAEFFLERVVEPQLKAIQDMVAKFGPNVHPIG